MEGEDERKGRVNDIAKAKYECLLIGRQEREL
jgi:hypothetical protein